LKFHTIITHEYPDLDALLCCYLLIQYGGEKYPGIKDAKIQFCPAGRLPDNKTPEQLEGEGCLAVDIGGGRLDTHPQGHTIDDEKLELSAANLVAQDLGIEKKESLVQLLEFTRLQDSKGQSLRSKNHIDHIMALPNIIKGAQIYYKSNFLGIVHSFMSIFQAIEIAALAEQIKFNTQELSHVIGVQEDVVFFVENANLKTMFGLYVAKKYLQKNIEIVENPSCRYHDFLDFLETYSIAHVEEIQKIVYFLQNLKSNHYYLDSKHPIDISVSLVNIINGYFILGNYSFVPYISDIFLLFDYIISYEHSWFQGVEEYKQKRQIYYINNKKFVAVEANGGAVLKVARWQDHPDIILYKDIQTGHYTVSINKVGKLKNYNLSSLAHKIRVTEHFLECSSKEIDMNQLSQIGELCGWYLHQSRKLFLHGSPKARREPSKIPIQTIIELIISDIDKTKPLPMCPSNACHQVTCPYFEHRFSNCFEHRKNIRTIESS